MLYCFDIGIPSDWTYIQGEKEVWRNGILFDVNTKQFLYFYGSAITIRVEIIFPRTGSTQIHEINEEIIKQGVFQF